MENVAKGSSTLTDHDISSGVTFDHVLLEEQNVSDRIDSVADNDGIQNDTVFAASSAKLRELNLKKEDVQNKLKVVDCELLERLERRQFLLKQEQMLNSEITLHLSKVIPLLCNVARGNVQQTTDCKETEKNREFDSSNKSRHCVEKQKRSNLCMDHKANKLSRDSFKKRFKVVEDEDDNTVDDTLVTLDTYHSDLNLIMSKTRYTAESLSNDGFGLMWAGAKATYGFKEGKICYEVKVMKHLNVFVPDDEENPHGLRVGWSVCEASLQLGEDVHSYGYDGTGQSLTIYNYKTYGEKFTEGDVITCFLNVDSDLIELSFAKNGKVLDVAFSIPKEKLAGKALFPHILTKNCSFEANFGQNDYNFFMLPEGYGDYVFAGRTEIDKRVRATKGPATRSECEMIMMCGLPRAGKTTWVSKYTAEHRDKSYYVLGTDAIMGKMTDMGVSRHRDSKEWWTVYDMLLRCLNKMLGIACHHRRNFILDEANVYSSTHRRKMKSFEGFIRRAVVIVPSEEDYIYRVSRGKNGDGSDLPDNVLLDMKANFALPEVGVIFEAVEYVDLAEAEARVIVKKYVKEGRSSKTLMSNDHRPSLINTLIAPPSELRGGQLGQDHQRFAKRVNKLSGGYVNPRGRVRPLMRHAEVSRNFSTGSSGHSDIGMRFNQHSRGEASCSESNTGVEFNDYGCSLNRYYSGNSHRGEDWR